MAGERPLPPFAAIVVAAGKGLRVGGVLPKQYRTWRGRPLLRHSVETLREAGAAPLVVVIAEGAEDHARAAVGDATGVRFVTGGANRQDSVRAGLEALADEAPARVLVHDAARPDLPRAVIERLMDALAEHPGAIPVLPVVDSLAVASARGTMADKADRESLRRVQTPQAFRFEAILVAHRAWVGGTDAGDDAQVLAANGGEVALVRGDERLKKVTFAEDLMDNAAAFRIGQGFDVHRLEAGEELWLCGIRLEHDMGLAGHSDADVALHAITDAVLGAIGEGDIGTHFPPSDPQWAGARSGRFLEHAVSLAREAGYALANIDLTLICEAPKIGPHRAAMRAEVARLAGLCESAVSIKATTTERLGFTGRGEGIAAQAIVALSREERP
ncbi:bifunctional 2-C-methyl-D-erythritol 4-phosphate cytidylyltransferase/2-C-methyl-D-erythritol 2,4-cyclodiphosphate synthase [Erythrobacter sp. HL-111]|uniref:bifunctional 2-C-methyl-D-erythritol 4-phosphate cytidylyltransferase/2-C-methyl-D-erythritol 2,4-cyclodiphosphate synthase n=1 Tax=Erythrobacter sp. HL-111 TaxID=1798193 RepID=UPI0006DB05D4|nr:bifunctional 2-C-methyl-D-erythritol 4-phosphate cytidylyltransferase/2-C-methyl-D-erythritol 2,4-cyclodiphosphate synthase [Erythrobacter sp. HL-111]KPP85450.1 MAG: 2-C-methyl-D-erythritol 4-phosphate cytidylyltransferase / 2-C-methyl-D-erythritol 2,4-cyclodiphosph [Erythrobacteraceae bacterium HL-111]SDR97227.1 2-C-methyl-D-erythritol 2,4-cyclodiphosphate synthase [Erythrobacter sp. HL-111]